MAKSYGHAIGKIGADKFRLLMWINNGWLRCPRFYRRDTDEAGAKRFAERWGLEGLISAGLSSGLTKGAK